MGSKKTAHILIEMLKKYPLTPDEEEAVRTAIGTLGWTHFAEKSIAARKAKRDRMERGEA